MGTGESCIRGNISYGNGVYKSTDAGKSWTYIGLKETQHIARVLVDPIYPGVGLMGEMRDGGLAEYCVASSGQASGFTFTLRVLPLRNTSRATGWPSFFPRISLLSCWAVETGLPSTG